MDLDFIIPAYADVDWIW